VTPSVVRETGAAVRQAMGTDAPSTPPGLDEPADVVIVDYGRSRDDEPGGFLDEPR